MRETDVTYLRTQFEAYRDLGAAEISFEATLYLCRLCDELDPKVIYDLGSGWSSFLFRWKCPDAVVWSVDDNEVWLQKTKDFCEVRDCLTGKFVTWRPGFREMIEDLNLRGTGDLVLCDLGGRELRLRGIGHSFGLAAIGGVVVIDDMHKKIFKDAADRELRAHPEFTLVETDGATNDEQVDIAGNPLFRYCWVAKRLT